MQTDSGVHVSSYGFSFLIFAVLLVLTGVTVGVAYVDLGWINTPLALLIAGVKAGVVLAYFMHLKWSTNLTVLVAIIGLLWFIILVAFTVADYMSRVPVQGWLG
ncbi:MAG: cytochrome C oxidase subunit IV family protein [Deltaproteobacteria bacterium]|jgi:cytochrome c oxidase subunit 4